MEVALHDVQHIYSKVIDNANPIQKLVNDLVAEYCGALDSYMSQVDETLCKNADIPTRQLEDMLMNINSLLYWAGNGLEEATVKESIAKMVKEEQYNKEYAIAEGTMGDKKASALLNSQNEELVKICFSNAVKLYQHKIDKAGEMSSALKKIITHRISDEQIGRIEIR